MRYLVYFSNVGIPTNGLSPTIPVWRYADGSGSPGAAPTIFEVTGLAGWYYYDYVPDKRIAMVIDGTATLGATDRYVPMEISPDDFPQTNKRVIYTAWTSSGKPTAGTVYLYEDEATMTADTDPWSNAQQSYDFNSAYDVQDRPTEYTQGKN